MKSFFTPFKVGLVMIVSFLALAYMVGNVSRSLISGDQGYRVKAHIADATGLAVRSRVMLAGIPVGEIERIELDGAQALITIRMLDHVRLHQGEEVVVDGEVQRIEGATLTKKQASLLGDFFLEVTPGVRGAHLEDGDFIPHVIRPIGPDTLFEQMEAIASNVDELTQDVARVTRTFAEIFGDEQGVERVDTIVQDLTGMVATLNQIAVENRSSLNRMVGNMEAISADVRRFTLSGGQSVEAILADVSAMTTELRYMVGQGSGEFSEGLGTFMGTLSSMQLAIDNLNYSLENVQVITDRIADGEGTIGRLINDPTISDEAAALLSSANDVLGGVTRLQTWVELRSEYGVGARSFKNYLSLSLRPNPDKFYTFEFVDDPRGRTDISRTVIVQNDPDLPPTQFEERAVTTDAFKFSLFFGRRWPLDANRNWMVGGRFGLIESSGGVGFNLWGLNENFETRLDFFDFPQNDRVRMKAYSMLSLGAFFPNTPLLSSIFLQGGVDDVFNPVPRDFFFGGGLSFNDRDLRSVLIAAPGGP